LFYNGVVGVVSSPTFQANGGPSMPTPSESYRLIPLTKGQFAKVSPHRFDELNQYKWFARWCEDTRSFYAQSNRNLGNGKWIGFHMHRVILGLEKGDRRQGEHVNRDTLDNQDHNLRIATRTQNQGNRALQRNNTSGYKGVSWSKKRKKWHAQITKAGKPTSLGYFSNPKDAHDAYFSAAKEKFGEFARGG
jgi:hypothetical protein